jgi:hypothetical protein
MMGHRIGKIIHIMGIINGQDKCKLKYQLIIGIHRIEIYLRIQMAHSILVSKRVVKSELV